jgi:hypothetical protein
MTIETGKIYRGLFGSRVRCRLVTKIELYENGSALVRYKVGGFNSRAWLQLMGMSWQDSAETFAQDVDAAKRKEPTVQIVNQVEVKP